MRYPDYTRTLLDPSSAAALQEYASELHELYHFSPGGYHSLDEQGVYIRVNHTESFWLGYVSDELIGKKRFVDLLLPESKPLFEAGFTDLKKYGVLQDLELQMLGRHGRLMTVLLNSNAQMDAEGRFLLCRSSLCDVSRYGEGKYDRTEVRGRLRKLSQRLQTRFESERQAIARELHDELGCILSTLRLDISRMQRKPPANPSSLKSVTDDMLSLLDYAVQTTRRLVSQLNPTILEDMGLIPALSWQLREFSRRTGVECRMETIGDEIRLDTQHNLVLFRVLQEALTNVARHAQASKIEVSLIYEDDQLIMEVSDDGVGIASENLRNTNSHGIRGMEERMRGIQGTFSIHKNAGLGTLLQVRAPLPVMEKL